MFSFKKTSFTRFVQLLMVIVMLSSILILPASAAATSVPAVPTVSHNQWAGDIDGNFDLSWNLWYGNNATSWKLFEKIGAGAYTLIHTGTLTDNTPSAQSGAFQVRNRTIAGTYKYYVELSNSFGSTSSSEISVVVGTATGNIVIGGVDTEKVVLQFTQAQGSSNYNLSFNGVSSPQFTVSTNNSSVIDCSVSSTNVLTINGKKGGRASLKIKENTTGETRFVGVRIKNSDGSLPGMPDYVSVGSVSEDKEGDLNFWRDFYSDNRNKRMDVRYIYINGGPINGWRTWTTEDGARAKTFIMESRKLGMIPFFVYYNIPDSGESYALDLAHIQDTTYMDAYFKDLKFFLDICKTYAEDDTVGIVFEPDFLGYMMQQSGQQPSQIAAQVSAAYSSGVLTQGTDPAFPNTVEGLVKSINYIVSKYYPQAYYGWQFNLWAYDGNDVPATGILHKTETLGLSAGLTFIREKAQLITDYYVSAGVKTYGADFVSIDKYGLDGGAMPGAATDPASSTWFWNADIWNNYLEFVEVMKTRSSLPVILWQIPVGHINTSQSANPYSSGLFPDLNGTDTKYEDSAPVFFLGDTFKPGSTNRFNYFKTNVHGDSKITSNGTDTITWGQHMDKARDKGVVSILFGAGVNSSTDGVGSPPTDDYWWITQAQKYFLNPVPLSGTTPPIGQAPTPGTISVDSPSNTGSYTITVNVPSGNTATSIKLYENNTAVLTQNVTAPVTITKAYTGKAPNSYIYKAEFINQYGSSFSSELTVTVTPTGQAPAPGTISVDSPSNTGSYTITVNVPSGNTATSIKLYENNTAVLTQNVTAPVTVTKAYTGKTPNSYIYKAEFINQYGSSFSSELTVTVTPTGQAPAPGTISVDNASNTGSYTITVNVPSGNTATSIKLYENNTAVLTQNVTAPVTVTKSYTGKTPSSYIYKAEFINQYGSSFSSELTVTVNPSGVQTWQPYINYTAGTLVSYNGITYKCIISHQSLPGWEPPNVPALWQVQ